jgi:hypothetical protein
MKTNRDIIKSICKDILLGKKPDNDSIKKIYQSIKYKYKDFFTHDTNYNYSLTDKGYELIKNTRNFDKNSLLQRDSISSKIIRFIKHFYKYFIIPIILLIISVIITSMIK